MRRLLQEQIENRRARFLPRHLLPNRPENNPVNQTMPVAPQRHPQQENHDLQHALSSSSPLPRPSMGVQPHLDTCQSPGLGGPPLLTTGYSVSFRDPTPRESSHGTEEGGTGAPLSTHDLELERASPEDAVTPGFGGGSGGIGGGGSLTASLLNDINAILGRGDAAVPTGGKVAFGGNRSAGEASEEHIDVLALTR